MLRLADENISKIKKTDEEWVTRWPSRGCSLRGQNTEWRVAVRGRMQGWEPWTSEERDLHLGSMWPREWQIRGHLGRESWFRNSTLGYRVLCHGSWIWKYSEAVKKDTKRVFCLKERKILSLCLLLLSNFQGKPRKDLRTFWSLSSLSSQGIKQLRNRLEQAGL